MQTLNMKVKELLNEARRLINDIGMCKGRLIWYSNDDPINGTKMAFDSAGAIGEAFNRLNPHNDNPVLNREIYSVAVSTLLKTLPEKMSLTKWHDDPARTRGDVLAAFSQAIDSLEG